jgi:hypothetical protein
MPIVVDHSGNMPSLLAAIQLALAQKQSQDQQAAQQQAQQGDAQNPLNQLSQILAAHQAAQNPPPPPSYSVPGNFPVHQPPSPDTPQYVRPTIAQQPADHSSSILRGLINGQQGEDRLNNQDQLAQFRAQQADQRLGERNQQQANIEQLRDADMRARAAQHDLPQWLAQGLQSQHLKYSPVQAQQLEDFDTWDAKIDADPRFSEVDRARAHADIATKRRQVQMSPQTVSPDKWPVTPEQQLANSIAMRPYTLPNGTTIQIPMVPVQRAEGTQWKPTADGDLAIKLAIEDHKNDLAMRREAQQHQHKLELAHINAANKPDPDEARQSAYTKQQRDVALKRLGEEPKPTDGDFKDDSLTGFDKDSFDRAHADWSARRDAILRQYPVEDQFAPYLNRQGQQLQNIGAQLGGLSMSPLPLPGSPEVTNVSVDSGQATQQTVPSQQPLPPQDQPSVSSQEDLTAKVQSGELNVGDSVNTPLGPRPLTQDVYNKLMGTGDGLD